MSIINAFKAFFKAWNEPDLARQFLNEKSPLKELRKEGQDLSHLKLLSLLQTTSRLIDFLKEDISSFSDVEVGKAVRKVHADSQKSLEEFVTIRPLFQESEGSKIQIPKGFDASQIKLVGKVVGDGPYNGVIIHRGWKAHKRSLPKKLMEQDEIIQPAEVEIR